MICLSMACTLPSISVTPSLNVSRLPITLTQRRSISRPTEHGKLRRLAHESMDVVYLSFILSSISLTICIASRLEMASADSASSRSFVITSKTLDHLQRRRDQRWRSGAE